MFYGCSFIEFLRSYKDRHIKTPDHPALKSKKPTLLRALFTIGLFIRHFDLDSHFTENHADKVGLQLFYVFTCTASSFLSK